MRNTFFTKFCAVSLFGMLFAAAPSVVAETNPSTAAISSSNDDAVMLPDAPSPQTVQQPSGTSANNQQSQGKQTKRILGIVPNFRAVSSDEILPAQTPKEKFTTAFQDSFDYSALIFAAGQAGVAQAQNSYPEFHQGAAGYGRYLWHTFADQTDENLFVEGILPTVLHQDNRYYTKGHGGFVKRTAYSFTRTLVTRTDNGNETFNASEVVGAGAASGISSLYYPSRNRTWTKVGQRWLTSVIIDGATFTVKEFWPDVNDAIFHQKD